MPRLCSALRVLVRWILAALMLLGIVAFVVLFVLALAADSPMAEATDVGLLFVCLATVVALSFVIWPGRA